MSVRREERAKGGGGGGGSAPAGAGPPLSLSRATRPHRVPRPHRISHTAPSFHTHPNTSGLYTGTASWTWPKWPAQAAPPSPHVPHRSPGASGPMAGSYRPPGTGWPKLSRATGEVMRLTDRRRTWKGGGGTREGGLSRHRKAGAERACFFFLLDGAPRPRLSRDGFPAFASAQTSDVFFLRRQAAETADWPDRGRAKGEARPSAVGCTGTIGGGRRRRRRRKTSVPSPSLLLSLTSSSL